MIPLHSHRDFEVFAALPEEVEAVLAAPGGDRRFPCAPATCSTSRAASRAGLGNGRAEPAVQLVLTPSRPARFVLEIGTPVAPDAPPGGPPSAERVRAFLEASGRYGRWLAPPERNAGAGILLPPAP